MDRIYTLEMDMSLDAKVKEFQRQLKEGEEIVNVAPAGSKLIITTRESKRKNSKLLLEASS
jgi:uncharacterized protein YheU (UPF0270 family)